MRVRPLPLVVALLLSCSCTDRVGTTPNQAAQTPSASPSAPLSASPTDEPSNVVQYFEGCAALAAYFTNGGSSHDDSYDPRTDVLVVYSVNSRQFRITAADADCLRGSPKVAKQVRDAIRSYMQHAEPDFESALLSATKS